MKTPKYRYNMNQIQIFDDSFRELFRSGVEFLKISTTEDVNESREELKKWLPSSTSKLVCSYCKTEFDDIVQQREHYKLDWHRYNLKQNLLLKPPLTEEEFTEKADDVSSISGSDSEDEESLKNIATLRGKLFLKNSEGVVFSLYRCLLFEKKEELCDAVLLKGLQKLYSNNKWTLLMLGGGHFAGGVFEGSTPIIHKTFHAYTVRAGQGGAQSSKDNRSGSSKGAGASLRRYNELTLTQHIHDIVRSWKADIDKSTLIVYRATGNFNQNVLFGGKIPALDRSDNRLKTIPFATKRPTFTELKRVHALLTTATVFKSYDEVNDLLKQETNDNVIKRSKTKTTNINRAKSREQVERPSPVKDLSALLNECDIQNDEEVDLICCDQELSMDVLQPFEDSLTPEERRQRRRKHKKQKSQKKLQTEEDSIRKKRIYEFVSLGNIEDLDGYLKQSDEKNDVIGEGLDSEINKVLDVHGNSSLHVAAMHRQFDMVKFLLEKGADPCLRNKKQQTAYSCSQDKDVRTIFKNFAEEFPDKHNYTKAQIPITVQLTEEQLEIRKAQRKLKKEKDKDKKRQAQLKEQDELEKQRFLNLSDREKRALAAERRIISQNLTVTSRCFLCATDMSGKVPFEYLSNRFCSIECLKAHRLSHSTILSA